MIKVYFQVPYFIRRRFYRLFPKDFGEIAGLDFELEATINILQEHTDSDGLYKASPALTFGKLHPLGFEDWNGGAFKYAFLHKNWVVKVFKEGRYFARKEIEFVKTGLARFREHVAETYVVGEHYLLQRRHDVDGIRANAHLDEIKDVGAKIGIIDCHALNVGWDKDRFVFIDFMT